MANRSILSTSTWAAARRAAKQRPPRSPLGSAAMLGRPSLFGIVWELVALVAEKDCTLAVPGSRQQRRRRLLSLLLASLHRQAVIPWPKPRCCLSQALAHYSARACSPQLLSGATQGDLEFSCAFRGTRPAIALLAANLRSATLSGAADR